MKNKWKKLRRETYMAFARPIFKVLPLSKWGDKAAHYHSFFAKHGRWPNGEMLFNDELFPIISGPEIVSPERTFTSDKEFVKLYIAGSVGEKYNVPTFAVLRTNEDIDAYEFPTPCVIKPTHGCGNVTILHEGQEPDRSKLKEQIAESYYPVARERNYLDLKGKLIVEPLLFNGQQVHDYKVFCWRGKVKCILFVNGRNDGFYRHLFDTNWNLLPIEIEPFDVEKPVPKRPTALEEMLEVAEKLSNPFGFVRVDFYLEKERVLVGEITHCHQGANEKFKSLEDEVALSQVIWTETKAITL